VPLPKVIERRVFLSAAADVAWSKEWTADFFPVAEKRRQGDPVLQVASSSYLNFVVANSVLVLPDYLPHGTPKSWQERAQRVFESAFPGRRIKYVDAINANWVGGGAHCATLSEPAGGRP
jgi:agmatine deiminase